MDGRPPQRDRRGAIIPFLIIAYILFHEPAYDRSPAPARRRPLVEDVIEEEQRSLSVLRNSTWDPYFGSEGHTLNLTGLHPDDGYAWESLKDVKSRACEHLEYALGGWGLNALDTRTGEPSPASLYGNISGYVRGAWSLSKLQQSVPVPQLNLSAYAPRDPFGQPTNLRHFQRNVTGNEGEITLHFKEPDDSVDRHHDAGNVTGIGAGLRITDEDSYNDWELDLSGLYYPDLGQVILTTYSDKFSGIFTLPHLALSERTFEQAKDLVNDTLSHTIRHQIDRNYESLNPWRVKVDGRHDPEQTTPSCELIVYLQQLAPVMHDGSAPGMLEMLETELRSPTGVRLPSPPEMRFSMLAFSPDCGYVLESKGPPGEFVQTANHLVGPKIEALINVSRRHLLLFTLLLALQLFLLMRQMREASTPSTRSRISFYTVAMLALGDGFTTMVFILISVYLPNIWINLVATGFLVFISVAFFGMRFLWDIWQVQAPERERRAREEVEAERRREEVFQAALRQLREEREQRSAAQGVRGSNNAAATTDSESTSELPTTEQQAMPDVLPLSRPALRPAAVDTGAGPIPVFMPSDQAGLEPVAPDPNDTNALIQARIPSFMSLYGRFYLLLLGTLFLSINAILWPAPLRRIYFTTLALLYLSFWVPQIIRNVQRNCRHALNWEFVAGQSVLRLVPFAYVYGYANNVIFSDIDYISLALLAAWAWMQVVILVSQELVGPRWFVRKDWAPPAYDYHPVLREDEEGATMPIGFSQATSAPNSPTLERPPSSPSLARRASVPKKETKEKGKRIFDCAICMQDLEVPVIEAGSPNEAGLAGGLLARRTYMVTPCRHIFHSACLEGWMKYRLQCPICRETLPPL